MDKFAIQIWFLLFPKRISFGIKSLEEKKKTKNKRKPRRDGVGGHCSYNELLSYADDAESRNPKHKRISPKTKQN